MKLIKRKKDKYIISLIVALKNDISFVEGFIQSLIRQSDQRFEVIFVCEDDHDGTKKALGQELKRTHGIDYIIIDRKNSFTYPRRIPRKLVEKLYHTNIDFNRYEFKIKFLNRIFTKEEKNTIEYRYPNFDKCFLLGEKYAKGKFVSLLAPNMYIKPDFVKEVLYRYSKDERLGIVMVPLEQTGDYQTIVQSKQFKINQYYEPVEACVRFIEMNQLGLNIFIQRKRKELDFTKRYDIFYRTFHEPAYDLGGGFATVITLKDYLDKLMNKVMISNRFLELKTIIWETRTHHNRDLDIDKATEILNDGLIDLSRVSDEIASMMREEGLVKLEKEYKSFCRIMVSD